MPRITRYCVGFVFNEDMTDVVLIRKNRPAWQRGKLNGVGGKVEQDEYPEDAMCREFSEETFVTVSPELWSPLCVEKFDAGAIVHFFWFRDELSFNTAETSTDEEIVRRHVASLSVREIIPNLTYLLPMAIAKEMWISREHLPRVTL